MSMAKLSRIGFFLFVTIYNYIWLRIIMFQYFYNEYGSMGMYYIGIVAVCVLLIFLLLPKKLLYHSYEESFKKSYYKYFYFCILLLENIFGMSFCIYLLSTIFIPTGNFYVMLGLMVVTTGIISYYKPKDVMEVSTLFVLIGYGILILALFFYPHLDVSVLLPLKKTSIWALPLFVFMFLGDNLVFVINKKDTPFSKLSLTLALLASIVLFAIDYFILITNAGDVYLKGLNWVGFISLSIEPISKYIGNFDFAYIYYLMICCAFKYAYNLSLIRDNIVMNHKGMSVLLFLLIFISGIICFKCIPMDSFYYQIVGGILLASVTILFWFLKECYHVRKTEE